VRGRWGRADSVASRPARAPIWVAPGDQVPIASDHLAALAAFKSFQPDSEIMSRCADIKGRGVLISANAKTLAAAARRKAEGRKIETPTTSESPKVIDLMNALSLARKKELKKVGSRTMAAEGTPSARRRRVGICTRQPCDRLANLDVPTSSAHSSPADPGKNFSRIALRPSFASGYRE